MSDLDDLLSLDSNDPKDALAEELVRGDFAWIDQLIALRKRHGLSQAEVAARMGRSQSVVSDIETMSTDPRLSTLRRYALAIGVAVKHRVFEAQAIRQQHPKKVVVQSAAAGPTHAAGPHASNLYIAAGHSRK